MAIVRMPDGQLVDLPDNPSPELKAKIQAKVDAIRKQQGGVDVQQPAETPQPKPQQPEGSGYGPMIARTLGPVGGAVVGGGIGMLAGGPPGAAIGATIGSGLGGAAGDIEGQREEIAAGERKTFNPARTAWEGATAAAFAGIPMGDTIIGAAAKAGTMGVISNTGLSIMEGQGLGTPGQAAMAFLTAGALQGGAQYFHVRAQAIKELSVTDDIAAHVDEMTKPGGATHGPDGEPLDIPKPTLFGPDGKKIETGYTPYGGPRETVTPEQAAAQLKAEQDAAARDIRTEKQRRMDEWMQDRRPGIFETPIEPNPRPLEKPLYPLFDKDGGLNDLNEQAYGPYTEPDENPFGKPGGLTGLFKYTGRMKSYMARLEDETGIPVYGDYDALSQGNKQWHKAKQTLSQDAAKILKGSDVEDHVALYQALMRPGDTDISDVPGLSPIMRTKVTALEKVSDKALQSLGVSARDFWGEFIPAIVKGDMETASADKFAPLSKYVISGQIPVAGDPQLPVILKGLIGAGTYEDTVGPLAEAIQNKYAGPETSPHIPKEIPQAFNSYISRMSGIPDKVTDVVGNAITDIIGKHGYKVDGPAIMNRLTTLQYAGLLAGRMGPAIHNALQPIQTALGPMGAKWLAEGYRQLLTAEGRSIVGSSTVLADTLMHDLDSLVPSNATRVGKAIDIGVRKFMWPFGVAEDINRGSVYLGTRAKFLAAAEKAGDDLGMFMKKSGAVSFNKQEAGIIRELYSRGDVMGAADRAGQFMVDNTQFMYNPAERPMVTTGSAGKYAMAFSNWPMQYGGYWARLFERGGGATNVDIAKNVSRFLAGNMAIAGVMTGVGKMFGDQDSLRNNLGWLGITPVVFTGSPMLQTMASGMKALQDVGQGKAYTHNPMTGKTTFSPNVSEFFREGMSTLIPGGGLMMDAWRARKEPTQREAVGRVLGLKRGPSPRQPPHL